MAKKGKNGGLKLIPLTQGHIRRYYEAIRRLAQDTEDTITHSHEDLGEITLMAPGSDRYTSWLVEYTSGKPAELPFQLRYEAILRAGIEANLVKDLDADSLDTASPAFVGWAAQTILRENENHTALMRRKRAQAAIDANWAEGVTPSKMSDEEITELMGKIDTHYDEATAIPPSLSRPRLSTPEADCEDCP